MVQLLLKQSIKVQTTTNQLTLLVFGPLFSWPISILSQSTIVSMHRARSDVATTNQLLLFLISTIARCCIWLQTVINPCTLNCLYIHILWQFKRVTLKACVLVPSRHSVVNKMNAPVEFLSDIINSIHSNGDFTTSVEKARHEFWWCHKGIQRILWVAAKLKQKAALNVPLTQNYFCFIRTRIWLVNTLYSFNLSLSGLNCTHQSIAWRIP